MLKNLLLTCAAMLLLLCAYSTTYYNVTGATNANALASWTTNSNGSAGTAPTSFNGSHVFNVRTNTSISLTANLDLGNSTLNVVGTATFSCSVYVLSGTTGSTFTLGADATLEIGHADGITTGTAGGIQTASRNYSTTGSPASAGNFVYNASSGNQSTGNGLPTSGILSLTINTSSSSQVVTLTNSGTTKIGRNSNAGTLTLTNGIFKIGASNTIEFFATSSGSIINCNGGNLASTGTDGEDGGTINIKTAGGGGFLISGNSALTFYNLIFTQTAKLNLGASSTPAFRINGTFSIPNNNWTWGNNAKSPTYGAGATLILNRGTQGFPTAAGLEWPPNIPSNPVIGVTPGYPNNVTLITSASSSSTATWKPTGNRSINGSLTLSQNARFNLQNVSAPFVVGGNIILNNTSQLQTEGAIDISLKGNWYREASASFIPSNKTLIFNGAGNTSYPQTISTTSSSGETQISNLSINNGTYVKLNVPVVLPADAVLTLSSGIIETSTTNILHISNTSTNAISGIGASGNFVNGPVKWTLANSTSNIYTFPTGKGNTYLPFSIKPQNAQSDNIAYVEAFDQSSGGTADGTTVAAISSGEHWLFSASYPFTDPGSIISISRTAPITPFNVIAKSTTASGAYASIDGTVGVYAMTNSDAIGVAGPWYFTFATHTPRVPELAVAGASEITESSALLGANIVSNGGTAIVSRGTYIHTATGVTNQNGLAEGGTEVGSFVHARTGLSPQTQYYYVGYATNSVGTGNSQEANFWTLSPSPASTIDSVWSGDTSSYNSINLHWSPAGFSEGATVNSYIILRSPGNSGIDTVELPDGVSPENLSLPSGIILAGTVSENSSEFTDQNLTTNTDYSYLIIPYSWNGINSETYNYLLPEPPNLAKPSRGGRIRIRTQLPPPNISNLTVTTVGVNTCLNNSVTVKVISTSLTSGLYRFYYSINTSPVPTTGSITKTYSLINPQGNEIVFNTMPITQAGNLTVSITKVTQILGGASAIPASNVDASENINVLEGGLWLGVNTNWNDTQNWCGGIVPTSTTDVIIPSGLTNYPEVNGGSADVRNIIVNNATTVTIKNAAELRVAGIMEVNGKVYIEGTGSKVIKQ